jgi:ribokinase
MVNRIAVIGSSNIDFAMKMDHLPAVGETVLDAEFVQVFGGKGANQAVAAARGGGMVTFVNCVGDDPYAERMVAGFDADGIDTSHLYREARISSGAALVMVGEGGNNYLSVAPGANYRLTPERIDENRELIAKSDWVLMQYEIARPTVERVLEVASEEGTPVIFNFAPAREFPRERLASVHTLVVNENEAATLSGLSVRDETEARRAARALRDTGAQVVIVTLGAAGSLVVNADGVSHVQAFPVEAVDTTAAGDTYCGCLAVALAEGKSLEESVRFASAGAAISVGRMGAQPSAPRREEIDGFLQSR